MTGEYWTSKQTEVGDNSTITVTTTSSIPAGTSITVTLYEDVGNDDTGANTDALGNNYDNSANVSLSGGVDETNDLTGFDGGGTTNAYWFEVAFNGDGVDPTTDSPTLSSVSAQPESAGSTLNGIASGIGVGTGSSAVNRIRSISSSGIGVGTGSSAVNRIRSISSSGIGVGVGNAVPTVEGVKRGVANGIGVGTGGSAVNRIRSISSSGIGVGTGFATVNRVRSTTTNGVGVGVGSAVSGRFRASAANGLGVGIGTGSAGVIRIGISGGLGVGIGVADGTRLVAGATVAPTTIYTDLEHIGRINNDIEVIGRINNDIESTVRRYNEVQHE